MYADCALRGVRDEGLDRGDGGHVAPRLLHQPIHHVLRSTRSNLDEELQHGWSGRDTLADTASEVVACLQQCTCISHRSLPLFTWKLPASQPSHFKILKEAQEHSGNILGYRAIKSSMLDTTEVIKGAVP